MEKPAINQKKKEGGGVLTQPQMKRCMREKGSQLISRPTSNPEYRLPSISATPNAKVGARRQDVPKGVSLLQDTRH